MYLKLLYKELDKTEYQYFKSYNSLNSLQNTHLCIIQF